MLKKFSIVLLILFSGQACLAMSSDNRYIPLIKRPFSRSEEKKSNFMINAFMLSGDKAFDKNGNDTLNRGGEEVTVSISELYGKYDQYKVYEALLATEKCDSNYLGIWENTSSIKWNSQQKMQGFGANFAWHQSITDLLSFGVSWFVLSTSSSVDFSLNSDSISQYPNQGDKDQIDRLRRDMNDLLGIKGEQCDTGGVGDFDFYVQLAKLKSYFWKCKKVDAGVRLGLIVPAGKKTQDDYPTSFPYGGDGHWGLYLSGNADFELKEDLSVGIEFKALQRFEKTQKRRLPIKGELPMYAPLIDDVKIIPGFTLAFSPYVMLSDIRDGLGVQARYSLVSHSKDSWIDVRSDKTHQTTFDDVIEYSCWNSEYISINVFYDFSCLREDIKVAPLVSLEWDIPINLFSAKYSCKTNKISLGVGLAF